MSIEVKKKKLELARIELGRQELEFKIEEKLEEIKRLEAHLEIQNTSVQKLKKELGE